MGEFLLTPRGRAGEPGGGTLSAQRVVAARELLDALPFPVLWIHDDLRVEWLNRRARESYRPCSGPCHALTHGFATPCDRHGEPCPLRRAIASRRSVTATHVHEGREGAGIYKVTAIPLEEGGVLEVHWPLDDVVVRDALTGVHTRRFFEQMVRRELELMKRMGQPFSLVLVDLDRLKRLNDEHGHAAGDAALRAVGRCLLGAARSSDVIGRLGGDEFCMFLPGTRPRSAAILAGRVRAALARVRLAAAGPEARLRASFGIHGSAARYDLDAALAAADRALYRAKARGRDRVEGGSEHAPPR